MNIWCIPIQLILYLKEGTYYEGSQAISHSYGNLSGYSPAKHCPVGDMVLFYVFEVLLFYRQFHDLMGVVWQLYALVVNDTLKSAVLLS